MQVDVAPNAEQAALRAAAWLAALVGAASARGACCRVALSGGRTPWRMLEALGEQRLDWRALEVFQVDERVVGADDPRRNAREIRARLVAPGALPAAHFHPMPVERADLDAAATDYAALLSAAALDVVMLGLGSDGHTASLVPGDALLAVADRDVGVTGPYQGVPRMSLTFRALDAARHRAWLVTGADKAAPLARLVAGDAAIPAGRVSRRAARVFADAEAAAALAAAG
jgi:6-phosphogluconolactonase